MSKERNEYRMKSNLNDLSIVILERKLDTLLKNKSNIDKVANVAGVAAALGTYSRSRDRNIQKYGTAKWRQQKIKEYNEHIKLLKHTLKNTSNPDDRAVLHTEIRDVKRQILDMIGEDAATIAAAGAVGLTANQMAKRALHGAKHIVDSIKKDYHELKN